MRAIVNMLTGKVAGTVGWHAREIRVEKPAVTVEDIFRAVELTDGGTLYDLVRGDGGLKPEYGVFVEGEFLRGAFDWQRPIIDSEQFHVSDWPMTG